MTNGDPRAVFGRPSETVSVKLSEVNLEELAIPGIAQAMINDKGVFGYDLAQVKREGDAAGDGATDDTDIVQAMINGTAPPCDNCGSDDTHSVYFGVEGTSSYTCADCSHTTTTFDDDEPSGAVSGDLPEAVIEDTHTHYDILDNGILVGTATDKGYHHHIDIPHLSFETVKENVKNWATETGYTLEIKD